MNRIWLDAKPIPPSEQFWGTNRGLHYGDGCFTTGLVDRGRWLDGWSHLARMDAQLARLKFNPVALESWLANIEQALVASLAYKNPLVIKLVAFRDGGLGYAPELDRHAKIIVILSPLPSGYVGDLMTRQLQSIAVGVCKMPVSENAYLAGVKHLNRLDNVLARAEVVHAEWDEGLMLDHRGYLVCGTQNNLVWFKQGQAFTPKLERGGVDGLALKLWRESSAELNWQAIEIGPEELVSADAIGMCNAVRGVQWVKSLDFSHLSKVAEGKLHYLDKKNNAFRMANYWHEHWLKALLKAPMITHNTIEKSS